MLKYILSLSDQAAASTGAKSVWSRCFLCVEARDADKQLSELDEKRDYVPAVFILLTLLFDLTNLLKASHKMNHQMMSVYVPMCGNRQEDFHSAAKCLFLFKVIYGS